jgi:hypothetical protein
MVRVGPACFLRGSGEWAGTAKPSNQKNDKA